MNEKIKMLEVEIAAHLEREKQYSQRRSEAEKAAREQRRMVAEKQKELLACYAELIGNPGETQGRKAK